MFELEDYQAAQEFMTEKSLGLMKHEEKPIAKTSFPIQNYMVYPIKGRVFYTASANVFKHIMAGVHLEAVTTYPDKFGTDNAYDVVEAVRLIEPTFPTTERHADFLQQEQFCYVIENVKGVIQDKVLRIDLFREIKPHKESGNPEFIGGIYHAFKHFSYNGINLATGNDKNDIASPRHIIELAIKAFFFSENIEKDKKGFISRIDLDENYWLRFHFYHEEKNSVHFITTVFKEPK